MTTVDDAVGDRVAPAPVRAPGSRRRARRVPLSPYLYLAPFFLFFCAFNLFPLLFTGWVSLHQWDPLSGHTYVGLANFRTLLHDDRFWLAARNTVSIWALSTFPQLALSLVLAQTLNARRLRGRTFWRMSMVVPNITSVVAVTIIFSSIFGRDYGLVAWLLHLVHHAPVDWQAGVLTSHLAIATMVIWRWTGYNALIYLAALQAVPREIYEAAEIDGAGRLRRLVDITVPVLRPTIVFTVIVSTMGGLQIFTEPLLFDGSPGSLTGGTDRQFSTLSLFLYEQGFGSLFKFGYASAIAVLLFVLIAVITLVNYLVVRRISTS